MLPILQYCSILAVVSLRPSVGQMVDGSIIIEPMTQFKHSLVGYIAVSTRHIRKGSNIFDII